MVVLFSTDVAAAPGWTSDGPAFYVPAA
jgi:hypothetical protein